MLKKVRPVLGEIMDENVYQELINEIKEIKEIKEKSLQVEGIKGTEKCFIRKSGTKYHVDLHALVGSKETVEKGHETAHLLKDYLREQIPHLGHVLIHIEPFNEKRKPE